MSYTPETYARNIVIRYGYKIVDWPREIPFRNLSNIGGGIHSLTVLRTALIGGSMRFERATPEEIASRLGDRGRTEPAELDDDHGRERARAEEVDRDPAHRETLSNPSQRHRHRARDFRRGSVLT